MQPCERMDGGVLGGGGWILCITSGKKHNVACLLE